MLGCCADVWIGLQACHWPAALLQSMCCLRRIFLVRNTSHTLKQEYPLHPLHAAVGIAYQQSEAVLFPASVAGCELCCAQLFWTADFRSTFEMGTSLYLSSKCSEYLRKTCRAKQTSTLKTCKISSFLFRILVLNP